MTVTNGYCTRGEVELELGFQVNDALAAAKIDTAIAAASRQIDGYTGRRFWQDATVQTRQYFADNVIECRTDDISTTTGLVVKVDSNDDGGFAETLTISTNFLLLPLNAEDETPARPYHDIRIVDSGISWFPISASGRPGVQVTAKFGYASVPDDVRKAALTQAVQLYKASDAVFGGMSFGDGSFIRVRDTLNPMAAALVEPYCKPRVA